MKKEDWLSPVQLFDQPEIIQSLLGIKRGFEKECLRVNEQGMLAITDHPKGLGSSLLNPFITTDYSEALLEFITPPTEEINTLFKWLTDLHHFTYLELKNEILWAGSMPCHLPPEKEIPIAQYGDSNYGKLKHIYRRGLGHRYSRTMQLIAGIHYNFSFPMIFWDKYHALLKSKTPLQHFISEQYLGLIRNVIRFGWIIPFLFGASPACAVDFLKKEELTLEKYKEDTFYGPYATSLRLSDLGYQNKAQASVNVSYNSLEAFIQTLRKAVNTKYPEYHKIDLQSKDTGYQQLNDTILQVEDEHYALVRPKRVATREERMLTAIQNKGIEYVELRSLDINPFMPMGVDRETSHFLDVFLTFCLFQESPILTDEETKIFQSNHAKVAKWGRKPQLYLLEGKDKPRILNEWLTEIIEKMLPIASLLDKAYNVDSFNQSCQKAKGLSQKPENLPSAHILRELTSREESYIEFTKRWSKSHYDYFIHKKFAAKNYEFLEKIAKESIVAEKALKKSDKISFEIYLHNYLTA